jgi:TonB-linked SusC/RagA family outer membrane protein
MKKIALFLSILLFMGITVANAQTKVVTGTVTSSDDGSSIPGVSVAVKGTTIGMVTKLDGEYSLQVPEDATTLVFSFVGMKNVEKEIVGSVIDVVMEAETVGLEEVMIVAYGTATKESFTGSASTIETEDIVKRQVSNITKGLAGQVAGVQTISANGQPGTSATVRIRGIGSMSASNAPLYVIDGVPYDGSISAINPNDIATLTVLKDAAASAIYGARGANGVILITTKKGKAGAEPVVTVDAKWGNNRRGVPGYDVMEDPAMYYETFYKSMYNSKINDGTSVAEAHNFARTNIFDKNNGGLGYQVYTIPDGEYFIGTNGKLNPNAKLGYSDGEFYYTPDNWYDELFDKGNLRQEYNVTISGSSDKISYYVSGGYLDDSGIVSGSGFSRFTGRSNVTYQVTDWLEVGSNIDYTNYNVKSPSGQTSWGSSGNLFYVSNLIAPIYPMYVRNADGTIRVDDMGITVYDFGTTASTNNERAFMAIANPAIDLILDKYNNFNDIITSKWFANIDIYKGLRLSAILGANAFNNRYANLYNPYYGSFVADQGLVSVGHNRDVSVNQQYLLTYKNSIGRHNFDILAGYESYELKMQYIDIDSRKLYNPDIAEIGNAIYSPPDADSYTDTYSTLGFLGRVKYDFDERIFLSASYRRDASSSFHPDRRWGDFGSVGGAWVLSKEGFFNSLNLPFIDMLKLKASYGIQGNDNLARDNREPNYYPYLDQFTVSNADGEFSTTFKSKGNPEITWETSYSFNAGLEFSLFNERVNGIVDYFQRKTVDLLYDQPVPVSWGYSSIPTNVGSLINKGVEFSLDINVLRTTNLDWNFNFNATHYKNEILDLAESVRETGIRRTQSILEIGGSLYDSYLREYAGVDPVSGKALYYLAEDGEFTLENGEKVTTDVWQDAGQVNNGSTLAKVYGGFGTSLNFYGFDLSVAASYQLGGKSYDFTYEELMHNGDSPGQNWHVDILDAWSPENPDSDIPRLDASDDSYQYLSTRFLVSSDYLSIDNLTLGYTIPSNLTQKVQIKNLRVYLAADNLALFAARKGLDPRQTIGGTNYRSGGVHKYTALRTISGGVTITF